MCGQNCEDIVNDINAGTNYYQILGVDKDVSPAELRRAFRQVALVLHPDKTGAEGPYLAAVRASEVLSDSESKKEYDDLLTNGIPWHENYYGKYAHQYGAPDHDIRYVLAGLVAFISISQYLYKNYKHQRYQHLVKKLPRYQNKLKMMQNSKPTKNRFEEEETEEENAPGVQIIGAEKPKLTDILVVNLVLAPYYFVNGMYYLYKKIYKEIILGQKRTLAEYEKEMREKYGMTEEEWEKQKRMAQEREEKFKSSNKYKRMVRFMRKRG